MNEKRLEDLETKVAYQELAIQQLSDIASRQQEQITQLETTCRLLLERLKDAVEAGRPNHSGDERPPHY